MSEKQQPQPDPNWYALAITAACEGGPKSVPAIAHRWCPGLAVTMADFGEFRVSHVKTGMALGGKYERVGSAIFELVRWALIARAAGFSWDSEKEEIREAITAIAQGAMPVPFPDATSSGPAGTRPLTVAEWLTMLRDPFHDEFPWESSSESPYGRAQVLLEDMEPPPEGEEP